MSLPGPSSQRRAPPGLSRELEADYVNEEHMKAFAEALEMDELALQEQHEASSPSVYGGGSARNSPGPSSPRIRKVSALSDFAPINLRVKRRRRGKPHSHDKRQDWLFVLLRWPLLLFIFLFIWAEFSLYVIIRQLVNTKEWLSAWRGRKGDLRKKLRSARTYQEWKAVALSLDEYLRFNDWKKMDEDPFYDWKLVRKVKRSLKALREKNDVRALLGVLETCIRTNFAAVESPRLYSETFYGTKDLIEAYVDEQEKALEFVRDSSELSNEEKKRFFKSATTNLGISALCLSGGASFGYYHFGVVKAFLEEGLLPRVITGTSAGGLIASLVCTRTDDELRKLLVPELAHRITACEDPFSVWAKRAWKTGARFDSVMWARKCTFFTRGSMTFREAFNRTGRILNISVIPADQHSPTKVLNHMTTPDTVIWSALLASAAVPGILNPVVIMHKLKDGSIVPWNWGSKFKDGSLRVDIPVQALNLYFNVTHPIVSQVNPHVHLFFFAPRGSAGKPVAHRKGKGWRGNFLLSAAEQWLKLELTKNFKVIRDLELLPHLLGQDWSSVFLQRFDGAVTIWPRTRLRDWFRILSDPDPTELERMIQVGQSVTWPKLHMIENRFRLEKQIILGRQAMRRAMQSKNKSRKVKSPDQEPSPSPDELLHEPDNLPSKSKNETPLRMNGGAESPHARPILTPLKNGLSPPDPTTQSVAERSQTVDSLRSPAARRKWTAELLQDEETSLGHFRPASPDPPPHPPTPSVPPNTTLINPAPASTGFFHRLRARSFPTLTSAFPTLHLGKRAAQEDKDKEARSHGTSASQAWSSDTSSDGDLLAESRREVRHPSVLNFPSDFDPTYPEDGITDIDVDVETEDNGYRMY